MNYEFINWTEDFIQSLLHQGSSGPKSLKKLVYSKTNRTALSFTFYQFFSLTLTAEMPGLDKSHHHSLEFRVQVSQFHAIFQKPFI